MASKNLRVVYDNAINLASTSLAASSSASAATPASNLKLDAKSKVWRSSSSSTSTVKVLLKVEFTTSTVVGCVALPFTNLTSIATIRVYGYTGAAPTLGGTVDAPTFTAGAVPAFDTGSGYLARPYQSISIDSLPAGVNSYAFGGGSYARTYVPTPTACTSMIIEIDDTNLDQYIEASRLIVGNYWSPKYNTAFGMMSTLKDLSTHSRAESGDLITNRGTRASTISFDLKFMDTADRSQLYSLLKGGGVSRPIFISLFPENSDDYDLEQMYQIYGKLPQLPGVQYANFLQYSSQVDLEEI